MLPAGATLITSSNMWVSASTGTRKEGVVDGITKDAADGGIFRFSERKKKQMEKVKFGGESTLKGKQLHCLGYLMELAYDLALAPRDNVSSSPGFETCLGNFGRGNSGGRDVVEPVSTNIKPFAL